MKVFRAVSKYLDIRSAHVRATWVMQVTRNNPDRKARSQMSSTPDQATIELSENWVKALANIDLFLEICVEDCPVWHSADDKWVSVSEAVAAVYERAGDGPVPDFRPEGITFTEKGFFNEASVELEMGGQPVKLHLVQIVEARDGKAVSVREYIGPEMGIQP
ncbi:hypothetical protein JWS13_28805 [Rhodococcus pseudokoreensis]|uniref:Ketosteroid isomerase-related protein n=2 Tax=Rhodococcus TaxID=1827 RepID=A0A974W6Y6_9NOCA|nr:hypothetical protein JWS13_28805 [Rhodococcus pseudokoreensis]